MARFRVRHHSRGYEELLTAPGVLADVRRRAQRVADAAGEGFDMRSSVPHTRARAAVVAPQGDPENKMIRSLDAGR